MTLTRKRWSADVHARLEALLATPVDPRAPPAAVFDWDDTVMRGDASLALLRAMDAQQDTTWHDDYFRLLETHGRAAAYPPITRWFAGHTPASFRALCAEVLRDALAAGEIAPRDEVVDLVRALGDAGWTLWVVTASPAVLIRELAVPLGFRGDHVLGMTLARGADGRFLDALDGPATFLDGKAVTVSSHLPQPPKLVAGDSRSDAPMMALAEHVLLIDGHDADLREEARAAGWMVQSGWEHTPPEPGVRVAPPGDRS